jgi:hypothetical protein
MFTGTVRQLDFIANLGWCQVIVTDGTNDLIAVTDEHRMQTLLEISLIREIPVDVAYDDDGTTKTLTRVTIPSLNVPLP